MAVDTLGALSAYRERIDAALKQFFVAVPGLLNLELSEHSAEALSRLEAYSMRPGKRIRGSLASLTYDMSAGTVYDTTGIQLGVILELMQNYLLIVDDVMDKSSSRRGEPTLHVLYGSESEAYGGEHEANMLAVNVGLLAQHLANLLLARQDLPPERLVQALSIMHTNITATGFGQLDDLYQQLGREVSEADIIRKYYLKSSYYTFVNPLQLGFVLAGVGQAQTLAACQTFGRSAGIAFQLHDDYLGVFGDTEALGKSNLDDIREGKFTLLMQYALAHASGRDKQKLRTILGNSVASEDDLATVQGILVNCGAKDYNVRQARHYAQEARQQLTAGGMGKRAFKEILEELVNYSITRQR